MPTEKFSNFLNYLERNLCSVLDRCIGEERRERGGVGVVPMKVRFVPETPGLLLSNNTDLGARMSTPNEPSSVKENKDIQLIRGIPLSTVLKKELVEQTLDYQPRAGDVIIGSYPKTGTTWMQYIVVQIITKGDSFPNMSDMMKKAVPFLEMNGAAAVDAITTVPRVYKHHMPYDKVKTHPEARFIYVYRKPEDTFVSYYHFIKNFHPNTTFDEFFENFLSGNINYGRYFEHVLSYLKHEEDGNILMVSYETLHKNRKEEFLRIAKFIGEKFYEDLVNDESALERIIKHTSFDYMKQNLSFTSSADDKEKSEAPKKFQMPKVDFFRKGIVGDGKNSLTTDQLNRLRDLTNEIMKGTKVLSEWLNN